jgi:hypothetical protein
MGRGQPTPTHLVVGSCQRSRSVVDYPQRVTLAPRTSCTTSSTSHHHRRSTEVFST